MHVLKNIYFVKLGREWNYKLFGPVAHISWALMGGNACSPSEESASNFFYFLRINPINEL